MSSVCLSLRLSVTLVDCDHIGWNSSKIIPPLVSLGCSLSADPADGAIYGSNESKMAAAAILDLFEPEIAPLDPPSPKTPP